MSFAPVTYGLEVLAHPDDPDINYRWARTQIANGDLKGASATLERMLADQAEPAVDPVSVWRGPVSSGQLSPRPPNSFICSIRSAMEPRILAEIDGYIRASRRQAADDGIYRDRRARAAI